MTDDAANDPSRSDPSRSDPGSWAFWRKRLARALVVGGLALAAARFLPTLPQEHPLVFVPPQGTVLSRLEVQFGSVEDAGVLSGTTLHPAEPAARLPHTVRLPTGDYELRLSYELRPGPGSNEAAGTFFEVHRVQLDGKATRLSLRAARPGGVGRGSVDADAGSP